MAPVTDLALRRRLRCVLQSALRRGKNKSQVFIEIFAGAGRFSARWARRGPCGDITLDLKDDPAFDVARP
eukprot:2797652-Pyramimonas_sp.AAC.1